MSKLSYAIADARTHLSAEQHEVVLVSHLLHMPPAEDNCYGVLTQTFVTGSACRTGVAPVAGAHMLNVFGALSFTCCYHHFVAAGKWYDCRGAQSS